MIHQFTHTRALNITISINVSLINSINVVTESQSREKILNRLSWILLSGTFGHSFPSLHFPIWPGERYTGGRSSRSTPHSYGWSFPRKQSHKYAWVAQEKCLIFCPAISVCHLLTLIHHNKDNELNYRARSSPGALCGGRRQDSHWPWCQGGENQTIQELQGQTGLQVSDTCRGLMKRRKEKSSSLSHLSTGSFLASAHSGLR
jgi:hypothetical protein